VRRIHKSSREENATHFERNLRILEKEQIKNPEEPRTYFYLARTYLGLERFEDCIKACASYLERSSWDQERYEARLIMGEAFTRLGNQEAALDCYQSAILEYEGAPDAYVYKARIYATQERWRDALTNLEIAGSLKGKGVVENPTLMQKDVPLLAALCLINLKRFAEAVKMARLALDSRAPEARELLQTASKLAEWEDLTRRYTDLGRYLAERDATALKHLVASVPHDIADDPRIVQLRMTAFDPIVWPYKSIAFYCGISLEPWDGNATKTKGIGGSETAVIELAKRFAKAGWHTVVYNWCDAPPEGMEIDGVLYRNYWQIDQRDTFDVLCFWRVPAFLDNDWKARKLIVDMHDVSNPNEWTPKRIEKVDHVFVKSEYHKSLYPQVPEKKVVVVGNGIDLARFEGKATKNPNRFVYTSTPNRGLENALDVWPQIKEQIPDAELHVYYGWTSFYESHKREPVMMDWMRSMQQKMEQPGIVNHGRVSQTELAKDLMHSSLWLYPTEFPEIHCITALEMQAAGVYPITTGFAALSETQKWGVKLPGDPKDTKWREDFVKAVVEAYKAQSWKASEGSDYAKTCSWDNVTDIWTKTLA
jgi:glycosyltransferase involved in cell wall biosynthesis